MPDYLVVARAESGVLFGRNDSLKIRQFLTPIGRVDIVYKARLITLAGFGKPVPMGLLAEISGRASSLDEALLHFSRAAQSLCPVFAFMGNSPIANMAPEICYDTSPDVTEREFFQQHLSEERPLMVARRYISAELTASVVEAVAQHGEAERIRRALGQYHLALQNWQPGHEVLALSHLWMGVEALTPVPLRRTLRDSGMDKHALAAHWGLDEKSLDAEVRKRLIMNGDENAYRTAKRASDGFEHGFLGFTEVHAHSAKIRVDVANHLRRSILNELQLEDATVATLSEPPYDRPGHLHSAKYLRGKLVSQTSNLAAPDQTYPMLRWTTSYRDTSAAASDEVTIEVDETFTGMFATGVSFHLTGLEVWGGQESTATSKLESTIIGLEASIAPKDHGPTDCDG